MPECWKATQNIKGALASSTKANRPTGGVARLFAGPGSHLSEGPIETVEEILEVPFIVVDRLDSGVPTDHGRAAARVRRTVEGDDRHVEAVARHRDLVADSGGRNRDIGHQDASGSSSFGDPGQVALEDGPLAHSLPNGRDALRGHSAGQNAVPLGLQMVDDPAIEAHVLPPAADRA